MKDRAIKAFEDSADVKRRFVKEYADKISHQFDASLDISSRVKRSVEYFRDRRADKSR